MFNQDVALRKARLKDEYDAISKTEFWREYIARIEDDRKLASSHCETDAADKVQVSQGAVRALKAIQGLPNAILLAEPRKSS